MVAIQQPNSAIYISARLEHRNHWRADDPDEDQAWYLHGIWCPDDTPSHDDVIKWKLFPRYWPFVRGLHRSPVNSPHKGQWRGALMFSLICARINGWVNNREAGDYRRYRAHYDVIVMVSTISVRPVTPSNTACNSKGLATKSIGSTGMTTCHLWLQKDIQECMPILANIVSCIQKKYMK